VCHVVVQGSCRRQQPRDHQSGLGPIEAHGPEVEADLVMGPSERRSLSRLHRWTAAEPGLEAFAFTFG